MGSGGNWCLMESDPGVFTELLRGFGVAGVQVEELWGLEPEQFAHLKPVHGLVFLFKWVAGHEPSGTLVTDARRDTIFFAQQVIQNACATQALVNLLMNAEDPDVDLGPILGEFKAFTAGFDAANKGLCLSNSDQIRQVHNSFSRQQVFDLDVASTEKEDVFHFISYMPIGGRVYELDGLSEGPMDMGPIPAGADWLDVARPIVQARIRKYSEGEIHFNLMAVVSDQRLKLQRRLDELSAATEAEGAAEEIYALTTAIAEEDAKFQRYKEENVRRKHNYMPFIVELLKVLAKDKKLLPLVQEAKVKAQKRLEEKKAKKEAGVKA